MSARADAGSIVHSLMSVLRVGSVAVWTILWTTVALLVYWVTRRHAIPLTLAHRVWAPGTLRMMGARLRISGLAQLDLSEPYLLVANHTSQLDIPILFAALPIPLRFLAKEELRRIPLVGHFITAMGMIFVDRADPDASHQSIDRLATCLAAGMSLMAFPEGTRSRDGELGQFKTGAFVAAIKSGVSVVPICIHGASEVLQAGSLTIHPGQVRLAVGEPIPSCDLSLEDRRPFADRVRSRMVELDL